jgi:hypothetical protein
MSGSGLVNGATCSDILPDSATINEGCLSVAQSTCENERYSDRYDNASAAWVVICAILMFFMVRSIVITNERLQWPYVVTLYTSEYCKQCRFVVAAE